MKDNYCTNCSDDFSPFQMTRRHFLSRASTGIGVAALSSLLPNVLKSSRSSNPSDVTKLIPHYAPRAKRVI